MEGKIKFSFARHRVGKERERTQEVPGNANLWVNPPHLIVLLFVCDIDSSGGRLGATVPPAPPLCIPRMCLFYRWTAANLPSPVFPGFQLGTRPEAMEGCNYTPRNNKTKQMRGELHQRGLRTGRRLKLHGEALDCCGGAEMRVMDALQLNTSKSPLQAALSPRQAVWLSVWGRVDKINSVNSERARERVRERGGGERKRDYQYLQQHSSPEGNSVNFWTLVASSCSGAQSLMLLCSVCVCVYLQKTHRQPIREGRRVKENEEEWKSLTYPLLFCKPAATVQMSPKSKCPTKAMKKESQGTHPGREVQWTAITNGKNK